MVPLWGFRRENLKSNANRFQAKLTRPGKTKEPGAGTAPTIREPCRRRSLCYLQCLRLFPTGQSAKWRRQNKVMKKRHIKRKPLVETVDSSRPGAATKQECQTHEQLESSSFLRRAANRARSGHGPARAGGHAACARPARRRDAVANRGRAADRNGHALGRTRSARCTCAHARGAAHDPPGAA